MQERLGPDDRENLQDRRSPAVQLDKEPAIIVRKPDATTRDTPIWKLEASLKCRSRKKGRYAPPVHNDGDAGDYALSLGASGQGIDDCLR
jgi:hypothetical protein